MSRLKLRTTNSGIGEFVYFILYFILFQDQSNGEFSTRLVGLAALTSAINSEVLYNSSGHFKIQVSIIVRSLLVTLLQADISVLERQ